MRREVIVIGVLCVVAIILGAWIFFFDKGGPSTVSFSVLQAGTNASQVTERKNYRIKTGEELTQLWKSIYGPDAPAMPSVDFDKHQVLAVFDGTHTTGGYTVRVESVTDDGLHRNVRIIHEEPDDTCMVTEAFSSPYQLIVVPKSTAQIVREDITLTRSCK